MTCENIRDLFAEALYNELEPRRKEEFDRHIATCESCRREFDELKRTLAVLSLRTRVEPTEEEWMEFSRGLDERLGTLRQLRPTEDRAGRTDSGTPCDS